MEILSYNLEENLKLILDSIEESEFIAIDTEFTGLFHSDEEAFDESDSLEDRYQKLRKSCESFFMCQLGLTTFSLNSEVNSYKLRSFSFYTIPHSSDRKLSISGSSMKFLVDNGFDMNKLFKHGIPCARISQLSHLSHLTSNSSEPNKNYSSPSENPTIYHKLGIQSHEQVMDHVAALLEFASNKLEQSKDFEFSSPYQKSLLTGPKGALSHFKNLNFNLVSQDGRQFVRVFKSDKEVTLLPPVQERFESSDEQVFHELGVSVVFAAVIKSAKAIVLHNGLFDLGFLYSHFVDALPETLAEFRADVKSLFPAVYDTKVIARSLEEKNLKRLSLQGLFLARDKEFDVDVRYYVDNAFSSYLEEKLHDSAYDSFITGIIFLYLREFIKKSRDLQDPWDGLKRFTNCIHINKLNKFYLNLNFPEKSSNDSSVLNDNIIKFQLAQELKTCEIAEIFSKYGDVMIKKISPNEYFAKYDFTYSGQSIQGIIENLSVLKNFFFANQAEELNPI